MTLTRDDIIRAIIEEGQTARTEGTPETLHGVISARGIQICLATALVESDDQDLANPNEPESESNPNKMGEGFDHDSVGPEQQQPQWWGTVAEEMDPHLSAAMFYHALESHDYNNVANSPGSYAQAVQGSAFPDRYDQRWGDAVDQFNQYNTGGPVPVPAAPPADPRLTALAAVRPDFNEYPNWSNNAQDRSGTTVDLWLNHTEEGDMNADALVKWMDGNGVSYHYAGSQDPVDGGVTIVDMVDTDQASWSVINSNNRSINFCYATSRTAWTHDDWLSKAGKVIDVAAYLFVQDAIKYPGLRADVIAQPYSDPPGMADHNYCSVYLKDGNNHSDVGPNFPWDYMKQRVLFYWQSANSATPHPDPHPDPTPPPAYDPTTNAEAEIVLQVRARWAMLGNQTVVETLAQLRDHLTGSSDAGKPGFTW